MDFSIKLDGVTSLSAISVEQIRVRHKGEVVMSWVPHKSTGVDTKSTVTLEVLAEEIKFTKAGQ